MSLSMLKVFSQTRAVPPEEFPASEWLFSVEPQLVGLRWASTALFAVSLLLFALRERRAGAVVGRTALACMAAAAWAASFAHGSALLAVGVALFALFLITDDLTHRASLGPIVSKALVEPLRSLGPLRIFSQPAVLLLPALAAFLALVTLELALYTAPFSGWLFETRDFVEFIALSESAAVISAFRLAAELTLLLLTIRELCSGAGGGRAFLRLAALSGVLFSVLTASSWSALETGCTVAVFLLLKVWLSRSNPYPQIFAFTIPPALFFFARAKDIVVGALSDELSALGLTWLVYLLFGLLALALAAWAHLGLRRALRDFAPHSLRETLEVLVTAFACPVLAWLPPARSAADRLRSVVHRGALLAFPFLTLYVFLLLELNYPTFTDYAQFLEPLYSTLFGYVVVIWLLVARTLLPLPTRPHPRLRRAVVVLVVLLAVVSVALFVALNGRQTSRLIADQYSKVAGRCVQLARVVPEEPHLSLAESGQPSGPPAQLARQATFPERRPTFYKNRRPLILLLIWDAARWDHLSPSGYARETSPTASRLAQEGIAFTNATSNATATTASLRHLFTGKYTSRYMLAQDHPAFFVGALAKHGYDGFLLNILGSDYNGVSREAFFRQQDAPERLDAQTVDFGTYGESEKMDRALELLDGMLAARANREHPADGLFIYLHSSATHLPWKNWDDHEYYGETPVDRYDNSMGHQDHAMSVFFDALRARGLYDDALIILTADHGAGLGEHGRLGGFEPYQEQIRVPLIIKAPGFAPRVVDQPVAAGIDLAPTLVSLFEPGAVNPYDGFSLTPLMSGALERFERRFILVQSAFEDTLALVDLETHYKLHVQRKDRYESLYDLDEDPGETRDLADQDPARVEEYLKFLRSFVWERREDYGNPYHYKAFVREP